MILIDVVPNILKRAVPVHFLGQSAFLGYGIASLFLETRARVIQWTIHRQGRTQKIQITEVTKFIEGLTRNSQIMQKLADILEAKIQLHPGHWLSWNSLQLFYQPSPNLKRTDDISY